MSQPAVSTSAPRASIASRPASRCSGLRLAMTIEAPGGGNSMATALPRPVPAPVMNTVWPLNVPGGRALSPSAGASGSPVSSATSAPRVLGLALLGSRRPELGEVVGLHDERLEHQLVGHRRADGRLGQ